MRTTTVDRKSKRGEKASPDARQRARFQARSVLWNESGLRRVRACGARVTDAGRGVVVRLTPGGDSPDVVGFGNLQTCGSCWSCPVCASKIAATRQQEVSAAITAWRSKGYDVLHATFTVRHTKTQRLATVWDAVQAAWSAITTGRAWVEEQETYGVRMPRTIKTGKRKGEVVENERIGYCRVVETTHGAKGWHVHVHVLLFVDSFGLTEQDAQALGASMFGRWSAALVAQGLRRPSDEHGWDIRIVTDADPERVFGDYFTKHQYNGAAAAAAELAQGHAKQAKNGNLHPFQLLGALVDLGDADYLDLWREWERGSKGRRQMTWSLGLRDYLDLGSEKTDEEIAEEEIGGAAVVEIDASDWHRLARWWQADIADMVRADPSGDALRAYLDDERVGWSEARGPGEPMQHRPHKARSTRP
ncbi:MAG: phiB5 09 [Frankiales bacterium]|nr:phiB5 09 [Frankiales bacterium]